jgi:hypothetical protein
MPTLFAAGCVIKTISCADELIVTRMNNKLINAAFMDNKLCKFGKANLKECGPCWALK